VPASGRASTIPSRHPTQPLSRSRHASHCLFRHELEWAREDGKLSKAQRDAAVDDLIALVVGVDGILQTQAGSDAAYFLRQTGMAGDTARAASVGATLLKAYRWQYIVSGALEPRFQEILGSLIDETQMKRVLDALTPLMYARPLAMQRAMS